MIKKRAFRKMLITTFVFFIVLTLYMIPSKKHKDEKIYTYVDTTNVSLYLKNDYNQLTKVDFKIPDRSIDNTIKEIIKKLTNSKDKTIPSEFIQVIPENTKLERVYINEGIVYLNFSKDFLKISNDEIEKIVESISYSLLNLDKVKGVSIYVNDENISKLFDKNIPDIITKEYGINKRIELKNLNNVSQVTVFYVSSINI